MKRAHIKLTILTHLKVFPGKESAWQGRRLKRRGFYPWVGKIPWMRKWEPTPVFLPGESRGQRGLAGVVHGVAESDRLSATHLNPPLQEAWSLISLLSGHHEAPCLPPDWSAAHSRLVAELGSLCSCPRVHKGAPEVSGRDCFELILMDRPQEGQCAPSCPSSRGQPPMRGRHRVVLTLSSADLRPWLCFLLGLSGSSPVSLSCGPSSAPRGALFLSGTEME